jgi:K+ transporter
VLASAAVITGMMALVYGAIGLGVIGLAFMALGYFNPHYLHSLHLI